MPAIQTIKGFISKAGQQPAAIRVGPEDNPMWIMVANIACVTETSDGCLVFFIGEDSNHVSVPYFTADQFMFHAGFPR